MKKDYCVAIDLGGSFIKGGILDSAGKLYINKVVKTECEKGNNIVVDNIVSLVNMMMDELKISVNSIYGMGIGVPGIVDYENGIIIRAHNLQFHNFELKKELNKKLNLNIKLANDANLAALGEAKYGCGKGSKNFLMLTLGTGVGGGCIVDGKILQGNKGTGGEFGHVVMKKNGNLCACGRKGCFEAYVSATAVRKKTISVMKKHKDSKMWEVGDINNVSSKTPFDFYEKDKYANEIIEEFISDLSCGIINFANIFRPEIIAIGGGISNAGEKFIEPIQKNVDCEIMGNGEAPRVVIKKSSLGQDAGVFGAAALVFDQF